MIPTVNILGLTFTVERVPFISRSVYRLGEIDYERQEIKILDDLKDDNAEQTLLHEVVHGILTQLGFNKASDNEKLVQGLALGLHSYLKGVPLPGNVRPADKKKGDSNG